MNLWETFEARGRAPFGDQGFSLHFEKGVEENVRRQYADFARWLRKTYVFPVHFHAYLLNVEKLRLQNGRMAYGSFRWFDKKPPRIKIASAIEQHLLGEYTADELREQILSSFVHELSHYFQWILDLEQSNAVSERQANYYRYRIIERYKKEAADLKGRRTGKC